VSKAEQSPPFKMQVDGLKLVPAAAWDAERLSTYRNGSTVNVVITQEKAGWRQRKYWAILNAVVKTCPVRQRRAEDLHKAIRLKLGIVDSFTTFGGATKVELRSTTSMGEQEFEAFYHEAMDLLRAETGVDVETLNKESADVGPDEQEPSESSPPPEEADAGSGTSSPPPGETAPDLSAAADLKEDGAETSDAPPSELIAMRKILCEELINEILREAFSEPKADRRAKIDKLRDVYRDPQNLGGIHEFVDLCHETARRIIGKPAERDRAKAYLTSKIPGGAAE
jgi:hypothetical protein